MDAVHAGIDCLRRVVAVPTVWTALVLNVNYIGESGPTELMTNLVQVLSATR